MALARDLEYSLLDGVGDVAYDRCARCYHDADTGQAFDHRAHRAVDCRCGPGVVRVTVRVEPDSNLGLGYMAITGVSKTPCTDAWDCGPLPCKTYLEAQSEDAVSEAE